MKIAIDARMITMSGIGTYIRTLMNQGIYDVALGNKSEIKRFDDTVTIIEDGEDVVFKREEIALIRLAFDF